MPPTNCKRCRVLKRPGQVYAAARRVPRGADGRPAGTGKPCWPSRGRGTGCPSPASPVRNLWKCFRCLARLACATCSSEPGKSRRPYLRRRDRRGGRHRGVSMGNGNDDAADPKTRSCRNGRFSTDTISSSSPPPTADILTRPSAPGRFDRKVILDGPDVEGREATSRFTPGPSSGSDILHFRPGPLTLVVARNWKTWSTARHSGASP